MDGHEVVTTWGKGLADGCVGEHRFSEHHRTFGWSYPLIDISEILIHYLQL